MTWFVEGKEVIPFFVLPVDIIGLAMSIAQFLLVVVCVVVFERIWIRKFRDSLGSSAWRIHRILLWEFATVIALVFLYTLGFYSVILPLLFLTAFLSMWYLVRVVGRE